MIPSLLKGFTVQINPFSSLAELSQALAQGECSALEIATLYLDRIRIADAALHAFVSVDEESVQMQARASDLRHAADDGSLDKASECLVELRREWHRLTDAMAGDERVSSP